MSVEVGNIFEAKVVSIMPFGAFVALPGGETGLVHISEIAVDYVKDVSEHLKQGDTVKVKVIKVDEKGKISLSIKKAVQPEKNTKPQQKRVRPVEIDWSRNNNENMSFEDKMNKFKMESDEKMASLKRSADSKRSGGYKRGGGSY
ncbi:MAG: S1 RNA-binding domain-containing protein [Oscillospiraceae bacterium]|nr:S1 RNA-binding domain-containing protein [Oscillospiraceae bacterium]